jgi:hypothetical protein
MNARKFIELMEIDLKAFAVDMERLEKFDDEPFNLDFTEWMDCFVDWLENR